MNFDLATNSGQINQALFSVTHGLYILTAATAEKLNGQCLDALIQMTNSPPKIAISVAKKSLTHDMISETGTFVINVLSHADTSWMEKVKHFGFQSGRDVDKFADMSYELAKNGSPVLPESKAYYECTVTKIVDLETHSLFISSVDLGGTKTGSSPVTYNEYRNIKMKR